MAKLALLGGTPVRTEPFPAFVTVGTEEKEAVCRVIDSGVISSYLGVWHEQFYGGTEVQALEKEWACYFGVKHAVAVNSATSGLYAAVGAAGIEPGDEVIVSPYTMCASATAPIVYGGIPVFADVEADCFCLDPVSVEAKITPKTKAIIVVDIFGQPYDRAALNALAEKYGLLIIEDAAQAPGASLDGKFAGTLGQIGVFSLNYHKHIHCGEGGVVVTDDDELAERVRLIRNHAEAVVRGKGYTNLVNMVGFNYRMTELNAAVARCQLEKLEANNKKRLANVHYLEQGLQDIHCLSMPKIRKGAQSVYYIHACLYDEAEAGVSIQRFAEAVKAELPVFRLREKEGTKLGAGYVRPLYLEPLFQQRIAFGSSGWPFTLAPEADYAKGICPVCESLHERKLFTHEFMLPSMTRQDLDAVLEAFHKVWKYKEEL